LLVCGSSVDAFGATAEEGFVNLDEPEQANGLVAVDHVDELVFDEPGGLLAGADLAGQFGRADAALGREDVGRQKPVPKVEVRVVEDCSCGEAGLGAAGVALVDASCLEMRPVLGSAAVGALEPVVAPALVAEVLAAGLLVGEAVEEVGRAARIRHG